jgi:hypothetical protein
VGLIGEQARCALSLLPHALDGGFDEGHM